MSTEVELKAWVSNRELTERAIKSCCEYVGSYAKDDRYYMAPVAVEGFTRAVRIRMQNDTAIVTYKDKTVEHGIEVNLEHEFTVSDGPVFVELLLQSGFEEFGSKRKLSERYEIDDTTVELTLIEGLGTFIEVERIVMSDGQEEIAEAREEIQRVFALCGGEPERIESSSYLTLLGFRAAEMLG